MCLEGQRFGGTRLLYTGSALFREISGAGKLHREYSCLLWCLPRRLGSFWWLLSGSASLRHACLAQKGKVYPTFQTGPHCTCSALQLIV